MVSRVKQALSMGSNAYQYHRDDIHAGVAGVANFSSAEFQRGKVEAVCVAQGILIPGAFTPVPAKFNHPVREIFHTKAETLYNSGQMNRAEFGMFRDINIRLDNANVPLSHAEADAMLASPAAAHQATISGATPREVGKIRLDREFAASAHLGANGSPIGQIAHATKGGLHAVVNSLHQGMHDALETKRNMAKGTMPETPAQAHVSSESVIGMYKKHMAVAHQAAATEKEAHKGPSQDNEPDPSVVPTMR